MNKKLYTLPNGWRFLKWGELVTHYDQGLIRSNADLVSDSEGIFYFKMHNLNNGLCNYFKREYTNVNDVELDKYQIHNGDFLINVRNSYELVGKTCVVSNLKDKAVYNHMLIKIKHIDNDYNYYINALFSKTKWKDRIECCKKGTTTVIALYKEDLMDIEIPVPPINLMKLIANFEKTILNKFYLNENIISELEAMAKTLYDYWFLQFDFPDENGKPYKSSGGKMVWNEDLKREIPEGWEVKEITNFCDIVDCLHSKKPNYKYENEECFLLTLDNLETGKPVNVSEKYYVSQDDYNEWSSRIEVKHNDFVITNAGRAGDVFRIPKDVKCAIGRNLTAVRPVGINSEYLNGFFKSIYFEEQLLGNLDCGSFFKSFNVKSIKTIKVLLPEKNILKLYKDFSAHVLEKIDLVSRENRDLTSLRDFLLPMLMNGQVTFKDSK